MLTDAAFRVDPHREVFLPNCRTRAPSQNAHSAISGAAKDDFWGRRTAIAYWRAYNGCFGAAVWRKNSVPEPEEELYEVHHTEVKVL